MDLPKSKNKSLKVEQQQEKRTNLSARDILSNLIQDKCVIIKEADKCETVVIMGKAFDQQKIKDMLQNTKMHDTTKKLWIVTPGN